MKEIAKVEKNFTNSSDFNNKVALDHGIEHMNRVAKNVYKLMKEYNCDENICYLGYIAGLIHDIGMIYGKKNHAMNGSEMSKKFLEKLHFLKDNEILQIVNAILVHGDGKDAENCIGSFLAIADKIDMCKSRSLGDLSPIKLIYSYKANIEHNILKIYYEMFSREAGIEGLYMLPKSIDIPLKVANDLGLKVNFFINGKKENFDDRKDYKGEIYKRK